MPDLECFLKVVPSVGCGYILDDINTSFDY